MAGLNSFQTLKSEQRGNRTHHYHSLNSLLDQHPQVANLPFSILILLENLLRHEDGQVVTKKDIEAIIHWNPKALPDYEIEFTPGRVLLQDFTGVPVVADLASLRGAIAKKGGDPTKINPLQPVDLVIDHSVQVDSYGERQSLAINAQLEFSRNKERYEFLKWAQKQFKNFRVVPPATGICHQVNLEFLSPVIASRPLNGEDWLFFDTVVGTDSHTPMINGLGVLGWGVGGIEAEAAMLGQPCSMLIPQVIGVHLTGRLRPWVTATDLVLTLTEILRKKKVVGQFIEYCGPGVAELSVADRATISNMVPEYGATVGLFPIDKKVIGYLRDTGRNIEAELTGLYLSLQRPLFNPNRTFLFSDTVELDLSSVEASVAGPTKPQQRSCLSGVPASWKDFLVEQKRTNPLPSSVDEKIEDGDIVIAAITSCTNTSNPFVMLGAGLLAKNAFEKGLRTKPWVKTSLAPGSKVVTDYLTAAGLMPALEALGFQIVGYGCTTCIGNSGPLPPEVEKQIIDGDLLTASVLSGNRNFESRINPLVAGNYLMSPPLVVAYALAGRIDLDLTKDSLGMDLNGHPVFLKDVWPSEEDILKLLTEVMRRDQYIKVYSDVFTGDSVWREIRVPEGDLFSWRATSTYIKEPPFAGLESLAFDFEGARILGVFGDFITTDHISPAGGFSEDSEAGQFLCGQGVEAKDFNSYGSRRGHHEVMWRGTFANVRLQNLMTPEKRGGWTRHFPSGDVITIFEASQRYRSENRPLVVFAGKDYGSGSSRDWAAKGPRLLGIRALIAEGFERIHRSNLIGMGVAPLQFLEGDSVQKYKIKGDETISIRGLSTAEPRSLVTLELKRSSGEKIEFNCLSRIDTPNELKYFRAGGVLPFVLQKIQGV